MLATIQYRNTLPTWATTIHCVIGYPDATMRQTEINKYPGMCIAINVIESCRDIPDGMTVEEITLTTLGDGHLGMLSKYVCHAWQSTKCEVQMEMQPHWSLRH